jgi:hypothetical protein
MALSYYGTATLAMMIADSNTADANASMNVLRQRRRRNNNRSHRGESKCKHSHYKSPWALKSKLDNSPPGKLRSSNAWNVSSFRLVAHKSTEQTFMTGATGVPFKSETTLEITPKITPDITRLRLRGVAYFVMEASSATIERRTFLITMSNFPIGIRHAAEHLRRISDSTGGRHGKRSDAQ